MTKEKSNKLLGKMGAMAAYVVLGIILFLLWLSYDSKIPFLSLLAQVQKLMPTLGIPREKVDSFKSVVSKTRNGLRPIENSKLVQLDERRKLAKKFMKSDTPLADFAREQRQKCGSLRRRLSREGVRFR